MWRREICITAWLHSVLALNYIDTLCTNKSFAKKLPYEKLQLFSGAVVTAKQNKNWSFAYSHIVSTGLIYICVGLCL